MAEVQLNNPNYVTSFFMASADSYARGVEGLEPVPRVAKNGGPFLPAKGQRIEQGKGWYALLGHPDDRNMLGTLLVGGDVEDPEVVCIEGQHEVKDYDPYAAPGSVSGELGDLLAAVEQLVALKQTSNSYDKALTNSTVPKQERFA